MAGDCSERFVAMDRNRDDKAASMDLARQIFSSVISILVLAGVCVTLIVLAVQEMKPRGSMADTKTTTTTRPPHIVFLLLDDLGYNDVSWTNPEVLTPNMERLARNGVILNRNYVHCVCSPKNPFRVFRSRGEILTGKYAHRLGLQYWVVHPNKATYLPGNETTLAERLKQLGYSTHMVGKWHLGHCNRQYVPTQRGFLSFYGLYSGYLDSYTRCVAAPPWLDIGYDWRDNEKVDFSKPGTHVTDLITDRVKSLITSHDPTSPLFLFVSYPAPHTPHQVADTYQQRYSHVEGDARKLYLGMVSHVDDSVGEITKALSEKGILDDTVIVMSSDNGGDFVPGPSNYPFRGRKGSVYEGGIRVPGFFYSSRLQNPGRTSNKLIHGTDWTPTLVSLAQGFIDREDQLDGVDQSDMLVNDGPSKRNEILHRLDSAQPTSFGKAALRSGKYKIIFGPTGLTDGWEQDGSSGYNRDGHILPVTDVVFKGATPRNQNDLCNGSQLLPYNYTLFSDIMASSWKMKDDVALYNVEEDPEERHNIARRHPRVVTKLRSRVSHFLRQERQGFREPPLSFNVTQNNGVWASGWC